MRVLLVNNHCITDPTAGVTQSLRTCMRWLAHEGHDTRAITTARFETPVTFTLDEHLAHIGARPVTERAEPRTVSRFEYEGLHVTLLHTRAHDERRPDHAEARQFIELVRDTLHSFAPDVVLACNAHPFIREALRVAREAGAVTVFSLRGYGYTDARFFQHVDHTFAVSRIVADVHAPYTPRRPVVIHPPIDWDDVEAPADQQRPTFLTFINPDLRKGAMLFARLADMLGSSRPDIPILVVQSGRDATALNRIPGIDFTRYPQILASPPVPHPREIYALTRLLIVPSVWDEPFGRVAAEAMINRIPVIVSDRGSLPLVIGSDLPETQRGGLVAALPKWMRADEPVLPSAAEIANWYDGVLRLWDDPAAAETIARRGRAIAEARYAPEVTRHAHVSFFESIARQ